MTIKYQTNKDWQTPRLIARLDERQGRLSNAWNPAVSGRSSAMDKIRRIVEFAYMGNSEFEFGTTRGAADHLQAYIDRNKVAPVIVPVRIGLHDPVNVYALAPRKFHSNLHLFLNQTDYWHTAERTYFAEVLTGTVEGTLGERTKGWFVLENQTLIFVDRDICEKVRQSLGIKTPLPASGLGMAMVIPAKSVETASSAIITMS